MRSRLSLILLLVFIAVSGTFFVLSQKKEASAETEEISLSELTETDTGNNGDENRGINETEKGFKNAEKRTDEKKESESENESQSVFVYVCGQVVNEGVYELSSGARVIDAIKAAGGVTKAAAGTAVNQAEKITDGTRIYIPSKKEIKEGSIKPSGSQQVSEETGKVNINSASKEELMTLSGIGASKAEMIIKYREENGGFKEITDLMKISGIKQNSFNKIKDKITV